MALLKNTNAIQVANTDAIWYITTFIDWISFHFVCWVSKWEIPSCKIKIEIAVINLSANEQVSRLSDAISQTWLCVKMLSSGSLWCFSRLCNHRLTLINTSAIVLSNIDGFVSVYCSCTYLAAGERSYRPPGEKLSHTYHVTAQKW